MNARTRSWQGESACCWRGERQDGRVLGCRHRRRYGAVLPCAQPARPGAAVNDGISLDSGTGLWSPAAEMASGLAVPHAGIQMQLLPGPLRREHLPDSGEQRHKRRYDHRRQYRRTPRPATASQAVVHVGSVRVLRDGDAPALRPAPCECAASRQIANLQPRFFLCRGS